MQQLLSLFLLQPLSFLSRHPAFRRLYFRCSCPVLLVHVPAELVHGWSPVRHSAASAVSLIILVIHTVTPPLAATLLPVTTVITVVVDRLSLRLNAVLLMNVCVLPLRSRPLPSTTNGRLLVLSTSRRSVERKLLRWLL